MSENPTLMTTPLKSLHTLEYATPFTLSLSKGAAGGANPEPVEG